MTTETTNTPATTAPATAAPAGAPTPPATSQPIGFLSQPKTAAPHAAPVGESGRKDTTEVKGTKYPATRPPLKEPNKLDPTLLYILGEPRKHGTGNETKFRDWLITRLNKLKAKPQLRAFGNVVVEIGESKTLFSCHIDTVHQAGEQMPYKLAYDSGFEHIMLDTIKLVEVTKAGAKDPTWKGRVAPTKTASCLGADDGAGVWLLLQMIEAKIPGAYIFHRGEECGGLGSNEMLKVESDWLKKFTAAVAFDRAKDFEVITHQGGQQCASPAFGLALSKALTCPEMAIEYEPSNRGSFTDTKVYRGVISECVNVACGYYNQHGSDEYLDYGHLYALRDIILKLDWEALPRERKPESYAPVYGGYGSYGGMGGVHGGGSYPKGHRNPQSRYYDGSGFSHLDGGDDDDNVFTGPGTKGAAEKTDSFPLHSRGMGGDAGGKVQALHPQDEEAPVGPEFDSDLHELYETLGSSEELLDWFEKDPDFASRMLMKAIVAGRINELHVEMLSARFM